MSNRRASGLKMGGGQVPMPNTFIGGVGASVITSLADVASKTSLAESDIENFNIDESDNVSFNVIVDYTMTDASYIDNSETLWFIDKDEKLTGGLNIRSNTNIKHFYAPNFNIDGQFALDNNTNLENLVNGITTLSNRYGVSRNDCRVLDMKDLTFIGGSNNTTPFLFLTELERFAIKNVTTFSEYCENVTIINFSNRYPFLRDVKIGCKIYHNPVMGVMDRTAYSKIYCSFIEGDSVTINGLTYTSVVGASGEDEFEYSSSFLTTSINLRDAINNDTRIGNVNTSLTAYAFSSNIVVRSVVLGAIGNTITITKSGSLVVGWSPFKGGYDVHPCLLEARERRSCVLVESGTPITVNPPTLLTLSNQTSTTVDINFTPPTANANGTDGYEVWIDDGTAYRKWFEFTEITASGDTIDISNLENISGSIIKIRTFDGHYNFSEFTSEVTLT